MEKMKQRVSFYRIFAIVDVVIGVMAGTWAVYDIHTDAGWFAGLWGSLVLLVVLPILLLLLFIDFIVWRVRKNKDC